MTGETVRPWDVIGLVDALVCDVPGMDSFEGMLPGNREETAIRLYILRSKSLSCESTQGMFLKYLDSYSDL